MKLVFLGAYFNHHQKPLSDALAEMCEYTYIATTQISQMRINLGYGMDTEPAYVCRYDEDPVRAERYLDEADVIMTGSAPEKLVRKYIKQGKLIFRYSERPLKKGSQWNKYLPRLVKWHWQNPVGKQIYMLCASAYTASDYARFGLFRKKAFRWGYFPEVKRYSNLDAVMQQKEPAEILWVGRFLDWKHPDDVLTVAEKLKNEGCKFSMKLIGTGEKEERLREMVKEKNLESYVQMPGSMKPEEVRKNMESAAIFLFTSDRMEGWGAVVNEAMNSGCAVIASDAAGSPPYLIQNGENGMLYPSGDVEELFQKTKALLDSPETAENMGRNAYHTMTSEWCADVAAARFLSLAKRFLDGKSGTPYENGPCSPA